MNLNILNIFKLSYLILIILSSLLNQIQTQDALQQPQQPQRVGQGMVQVIIILKRKINKFLCLAAVRYGVGNQGPLYPLNQPQIADDLNQFRTELMYPYLNDYLEITSSKPMHDQPLPFRLPFFGFYYHYAWVCLLQKNFNSTFKLNQINSDS